MVAVSDIDTAKAACIAKINACIEAAMDKLESSGEDSLKLEDAIDKLMQARLDIRTQQYAAALNSTAMQNALGIINGAAAKMEAVAKNMKTVAQIIANLAAFLGAAAPILTALKGQA
jgi:hypothetical protein